MNRLVPGVTPVYRRWGLSGRCGGLLVQELAGALRVGMVRPEQVGPDPQRGTHQGDRLVLQPVRTAGVSKAVAGVQGVGMLVTQQGLSRRQYAAIEVDSCLVVAGGDVAAG